MIVHATSMGGNFLLNFGPAGDGSIRKEEQNIAAQIGAWMQSNGNVVYGCDYAGWEKQDWGYYTKQKGSNTLNLVVFNVPVSGLLKIKAPAGTRLKTKQGLEEIAKDQYLFHMPLQLYKVPQVIILETESNSGSGDKYQEAKT
jgi:hypothetical protein